MPELKNRTKSLILKRVSLTLFFCLFFLAAYSFAEDLAAKRDTVIQGKVSSQSSNLAIPGATVSISKNNLPLASVQTDNQGNYRIILSSSTSGTILVKVEKTGYYLQSRTLKVKRGKTYTLNFLLRPLPDTTPPTGSIKINDDAEATNSTAVTLNLSAQDNPGGSGLSQMQFSNDGAGWSTPEAYATTRTWTLSSGDGMKTVYAKYKDNAGNWSSLVSDSIILDTVAPVGSIVINNGATYANSNTVFLTLSAADSVSGISQMQFSNDNINWSAPESYGNIKEWSLSQGNGQKTVYVKYKDNAGNWSAALSDTIILDTNAPVLNPIGNKYVYIRNAGGSSQTVSTVKVANTMATSKRNTASANREVQNNSLEQVDTPKYKPGEIIIKFKPEMLAFPEGKRIISAKDLHTTADSIQALNRKFGLISIERIFKQVDKETLKQKWGNLENIYLFRFSPEADVERIVSEYKNDPAVEHVEPNYIFKIYKLRRDKTEGNFLRIYK